MTTEIVRAFVLSWLLAHGYQPHQVDAIDRYIQRESGYQPCVESRRGHYLAQWVGVRLTALHRFAGPGCPALDRQLAFMDLELRASPFDRFWRATADRVYGTLRSCFGGGHCR